MGTRELLELLNYDSSKKTKPIKVQPWMLYVLDELPRQRSVKHAKEIFEKRKREEPLLRKLQLYREKQHRDKQIAIEATKAELRAEYERNFKVRQQQIKENEEKRKNQHAVQLNHCAELKKMITAKEAAVAKRRADFVQSGKDQHHEQNNELRALAGVRDQKIAQLRKMGVPEKYIAELSGFDPKKALSTDYKRGC